MLRRWTSIPSVRLPLALGLAALLSSCGGVISGDAGVDGGASIDAGASRDAGSSDAGATDSGAADGGDRDGGASDAGASSDGGLACATDGGSTLSGVSMAFPDQRCVFTIAEAAAGIEIDWQVIVTGAPSVVPRPQDAGRCGTSDPSMLESFETLSGGGQSYCVCDTGLCAPPSTDPITLTDGTFESTFMWQGRNWSGPSDTGMAMGEPFPPGTYTLRVRAVGTKDGTEYEVFGTFLLHLVP